MQVWECKLVISEKSELPRGADKPFRDAVLKVAQELGLEVEGCMSGWGGSLTKDEKESMPQKGRSIYITGVPLEDFNMNKYEVGYEDEFIGIYYGTTEQEAIEECKSDIASAKIQGVEVEYETSVRGRLYKGLIARKVDY